MRKLHEIPKKWRIVGSVAIVLIILLCLISITPLAGSPAEVSACGYGYGYDIPDGGDFWQQVMDWLRSIFG